MHAHMHTHIDTHPQTNKSTLLAQCGNSMVCTTWKIDQFILERADKSAGSQHLQWGYRELICGFSAPAVGLKGADFAKALQHSGFGSIHKHSRQHRNFNWQFAIKSLEETELESCCCNFIFISLPIKKHGPVQFSCTLTQEFELKNTKQQFILFFFLNTLNPTKHTPKSVLSTTYNFYR